MGSGFTARSHDEQIVNITSMRVSIGVELSLWAIARANVDELNI